MSKMSQIEAYAFAKKYLSNSDNYNDDGQPKEPAVEYACQLVVKYCQPKGCTMAAYTSFN